MFVIQRNGQTTVITGWRAWLIGAAAFLIATLLMAVIAFVLLGVAITIGALLMIVVPVAVGLALLASALRRPGSPIQRNVVQNHQQDVRRPSGMNRAPVRGPERYACVSEERRPLLRGLLHHRLRTAQLQPLFAAAGYQSDHSAKQRHNGDLAGVHGVTSNLQLNQGRSCHPGAGTPSLDWRSLCYFGSTDAKLTRFDIRPGQIKEQGAPRGRPVRGPRTGHALGTRPR
jgi:hypothetical protein